MEKYQHRKAQKKIILINKSGKKIIGKTVNIKLKNHKFMFGCGAFDILKYVHAAPEEKKRMEECTESWKAIFNYGTLTFYWGIYEPEEGHLQKEKMMKCVDFLHKENVKLKGHPLCWHTVCADWLLKYDVNDIMARQLDRITREVGDFKGKITYWDVINETVIMPVFDRYDNAVTRLCNKFGRVELIRRVFEAAHSADPMAVLLINDFNTSEEYAAVIDECLEKGVPIHAIGIQSHQHQGYWGAEKLEQVLARFERFGLPIHFTENTLISGELMPPDIVDLNDFHTDKWDSVPEFEERQKREVEEFYRILFEHPLVEAVSNWDYTDGAWLNAPSGLLRRDLSPKPAYYMLKDLIKKEWSTEYSAASDENGCVELYGFKGEYEITVDGCSYTVSNDGSDSEEALVIAEKA